MSRHFYTHRLAQTLGALLLFAVLAASMPREANAQVSLQQNGQTPITSSSATVTGNGIAGLAACTVPLLAAAIGGSFALALFGQAYVGGTPTFDKGDTFTNSGTTISTNLGLSLQIDKLLHDQFLSCIARAIARAALQQIAVSTLNWINSGFNGSPSFVTNYDQFFRNVADNAVGNYLQSSNLAFLCSPFQAQVKIAVAQSYASSYQPAQCSLSQVTNNIDGFMNDFTQGGWPAFLSFTTEPTNNPYGAYLYAQSGAEAAQAHAQNQKVFDLQLGNGFLSATKETNCHTFTTRPAESPNKTIETVDLGGIDGGVGYRVCDVVNTTPGSVISDALDQTLGINTQSLETAKYFDEILNALISQLIQNTLYSGLSSLSSGGGYGYSTQYPGATVTPVNLSQNILQNIDPYKASAQTVLQLEGNNISNIRDSIANAVTLKNCGGPGSETASSTIDTLNGLLNDHEAVFNKAQSSITVLEAYRSQASLNTDYNSIESILAAFANDVQNHRFISDADVTNAQENQILLQGQLSQINQSIATGLNQCNATTTPSV